VPDGVVAGAGVVPASLESVPFRHPFVGFAHRYAFMPLESVAGSRALLDVLGLEGSAMRARCPGRRRAPPGS
jgi:hypothetical protein